MYADDFYRRLNTVPVLPIFTFAPSHPSSKGLIFLHTLHPDTEASRFILHNLMGARCWGQNLRKPSHASSPGTRICTVSLDNPPHEVNHVFIM